VNDLGIGPFGYLLFPGTTTLHTRLRYMLFIPWLLRRARRERSAADIGDDCEGILGSAAGQALKPLPSRVPWTMLGTWGIRPDYSPESSSAAPPGCETR